MFIYNIYMLISNNNLGNQAGVKSGHDIDVIIVAAEPPRTL